MSKSFVLRHAKLYTPYTIVEDGYLVVEDGVIVDLGWEPLHKAYGYEEIDLKGFIIGPGFVDTHIHGVHGYDTMDAKPESFTKMARALPKYGVTSFIPSTVTAPHDLLVKVSATFYNVAKEWSPGTGARLLGLHLEGPYINPVKAGAQNKEFIRKPDIEEFNEYVRASRGLLREVTVAPEIEGSLELIKYASSRNIVVQIGHTNATYEEAIRGVVAGASKATHLYNGMREIHHREPGVAVALLSSSAVYLELIADFIHVKPEMVKFTIEHVGINRIVLVTDAISATGLPDGIYELGGLKIKVEKGVSRLVDTGGLAGSTLTFDRAFKNLVKLGYSIGEVFVMSSTNPAKAVGALHREKIGVLKPGYKADIVVLDKDLNVVATVVEGEVVYKAPHTAF